MATLTWVGGGNDDANNPQDWSPPQVPASGDTLIMPDGTMNISGVELKGNTLQVGVDRPSSGTPGSQLSLSDDADVSVNHPLVTNGDDFVTGISHTGNNTLSLDAPTGSAPIDNRTVNVDIWSGTLSGSCTTDYSTLSISSPTGNGTLHNESSAFAGSSATIDTAVVGQGSFDVTALPTSGGIVDDSSLEFGGKVSSGETITAGHTITPAAQQWDTVRIDEPKAFHGSIAMQPSAEVDLVGPGNADSDRIQDDKLWFISDNHVIDTLKLTNDSSVNLVVSTNDNDAYVTEQGLSNPPPGSTTLPQTFPQATAPASDITGYHASDPAQWSGYSAAGSTQSSYGAAPDPGHAMQAMMQAMMQAVMQVPYMTRRSEFRVGQRRSQTRTGRHRCRINVSVRISAPARMALFLGSPARRRVVRRRMFL